MRAPLASGHSLQKPETEHLADSRSASRTAQNRAVAMSDRADTPSAGLAWPPLSDSGRLGARHVCRPRCCFDERAGVPLAHVHARLRAQARATNYSAQPRSGRPLFGEALAREGIVRPWRRSRRRRGGVRRVLPRESKRRVRAVRMLSSSGDAYAATTFTPAIRSFRVSSGPGARLAWTRVPTRPCEREPGAVAGRRGSGRQQAQPVTPAIAAKEGSRRSRSQRRTVEGIEMRTSGEQEGPATEGLRTRIGSGGIPRAPVL